ncbi:MAG: hypothetical protein A3I05_00375 [Deltaproteobacteria bacterium RIFCSPLOWO2_02_FULL_44_10]|nr:MAG: hypothetical protein A3C46_01240 [Deltaproteobacteria bacterium RIFCSPHIGHO2_02_FULL_44_16]OGQ47261.1 MAG: hypothetical protein A3I05_00375 [Deltaproteobacteria bacterium RIFCSPLOWO2_02_FULL_44_10]
MSCGSGCGCHTKKVGQTPRVAPDVQMRHLIPSAKTVIAVGSGKGGVGKSSVAVNLAVALAKQGERVALFDGDIYGPSIPKMLGTAGAELTLTDEKLNPLEAHGLKTLSIGNIVPPNQATIWRGPMLHQALQHLMSGTNWGELDYVIVDLPPGTGDVHLTMMQSLKITGAIIVSTPQQVALADVRKCVDMFQKVEIPIMGIVENMSYFECHHGEKYFLFGKGGVKDFCEGLHLPFLGQIPLVPEIMEGCEKGIPYALQDQRQLFAPLAEHVMATTKSVPQKRALGAS